MTPLRNEPLPAGTLYHYQEDAGENCPVGPAEWDVREHLRGRRIVIFGVPGAFTPTCSEKHVPGYVARYEAFRALGIDELWCISVNDAHVMRAWGLAQHAQGAVRMLADGNCDYTRRLGLDVDLRSRGMGCRSRRYAMLVEDGVLRELFLEEPGAFQVSDAQSMLDYLRRNAP